MNPSTSIAAAKSIVWNALAALPGNGTAGPTASSAMPALTEFFDPNCEWHTFHPINELHGMQDINAKFWQPLLHAMPDMERRTHQVATFARERLRQADCSLSQAQFVIARAHGFSIREIRLDDGAKNRARAVVELR